MSVRLAYPALLLGLVASAVQAGPTLVLAEPDPGPTITLPARVEGAPGAFVKVPATTKGEVVQWVPLTPGLNLFPVDLLKDSRTAIVSAPNPGTYRLLAYTALGNKPSEPAFTDVVIGGGGPAPGPGPTPPDPTPADPLLKKLQAAYDADVEPSKAAHLACLVGLWKSFATMDVGSGTTAGQFYQILKNESGKVLPPDALPTTRLAIATELRQILPSSPDTILTQDHKANFRTLAGRIGKTLGELK